MALPCAVGEFTHQNIGSSPADMGTLGIYVTQPRTIGIATTYIETKTLESCLDTMSFLLK